MGAAELGLPFGGAEGGPRCGGDPVGAGEVWRGVKAFKFEELEGALGAGGEGDHAMSSARRPAGGEVDQGEHLAADAFVADPEDQVVAPLKGFGDMREREEKGPGSLGVHGAKYRRALLTGAVRRVWLLYFEEACPLRARPFLCTRLHL